MKKAQFIQMMQERLADLSDDDEVFVQVDGGEYWGSYHAEPSIKIETTCGQDWVGHPGSPHTVRAVQAAKVAIIKDL